MGSSIIDLHVWLQTAVGQYLLDWERAQVDAAVADIFGYHALQLGLPELDSLRANRMPHQWLALDHFSVSNFAQPPGLVTDFTALPFPASSLDLVVLPHTLELSADPHTVLREVERVLVPEGRVVICGLNPWSLWGLRQYRAHCYRKLGFGKLFLPVEGTFLTPHRLKDWLQLLSLEVESAHFGCYRAAVNGEAWLQRLQWMDKAGVRWWPILGAAYSIVAVKKVRGMRLLGPRWKTVPAGLGQSVSVARKAGAGRKDRN